MSETPIREHVGRCIHAEIHVAAAPARVWEAWANPERFCQWFSDEARGEAVTGGTLTWVFRDFGFEMPLQVLEAIPEERLLLYSEPPGRPPNLQEILFSAEDDGTRVRLVHSGFAEGEAGEAELAGCISGWKMALALLAVYTESHFGQRRSRFNVMSPANVNLTTILDFFRNADRLSRWFTETGAIGSEGEDVSLVLRDGRCLTGTVLAVSATELAISWQEINGSLIFKCFSAGEAGLIVGLDGSGWGLDPEKALAIGSEMEDAILRLSDLINETS